MNRLILVVTAIGVTALAVYAVSTSEPDEEIAEASVTQRAEPPPVLVALPQSVKKVIPTDFPSLAREIQRELRRVGCYGGEVNGRWTPSTRDAMKAFVDDANAVLPVDKPDPVLLSLLHGEHGTACDSNSETTVASSSATVTGSIDRLPPPTGDTAPTETTRTATIQSAREPSPRYDDAAPAAEPTPAPIERETVERETTERETVETAALDDPSLATEAGVVPPPVVATPQPRRQARNSRNRPPKVVRSLIRSIKRGLAPFGIR